MLVAVLPTSARTRIPFDLEISVIELDLLYFLGIDYGDGDR